MGSSKISVDIEHLRVMVNSSLRYALPRATYMTGLTSDILMTLPLEVWDERTLSVALQDLNHYLTDWDMGFKPNWDCDHDIWKSLYSYLLEVRRKKDETNK